MSSLPPPEAGKSHLIALETHRMCVQGEPPGLFWQKGGACLRGLIADGWFQWAGYNRSSRPFLLQRPSPVHLLPAILPCFPISLSPQSSALPGPLYQAPHRFLSCGFLLWLPGLLPTPSSTPHTHTPAIPRIFSHIDLTPTFPCRSPSLPHHPGGTLVQQSRPLQQGPLPLPDLSHARVSASALSPSHLHPG